MKTWFVTGASSGFGAALARAALARGDQVVLAARRAADLEALATPFGGRALPVALDVTDAAARSAAVAAAHERFGRIDVLANIAGRGSLGAAEEFSATQLREQMELNFFAAAELTRAVLPGMRAQGTGHVLQLTSIGGLIAAAGFAPYCASKYALEGWSEALADEVRHFGIRVTIVEPGAFRTEFAEAKNMRPAQPINAYRPLIAPVEDYLYGTSGQQPGDPERAAALMLAVVDDPAPPLRLLMGVDAWQAWEAKHTAMTAELSAWRARGEATGFPDAAVLPIAGR